jgi:hypothetical protein
MTQLTAWSYSRLAQWEACPLAFKLKHLDKVHEEQSPAMKRGDDIHKIAARFLANEKFDSIPGELHKFSYQMNELRAMPASMKRVEQQWGFTKDWKPTEWFGNKTWLRAVLDACVVYPDGTADVIDHKTGKRYGSNKDQMELFALATFCKFPEVSHVTTRLWYLDLGVEEVEEFQQENRSEMIAAWEARVAPMFADTVFAPRPNEKCRWCAFAKGKGGQCKFG